MTTSSRTTGSHSWASTGRTSRNQPTAPAIANIAPRMLTGVAVTIPAHTRVNPNASTIGQAVGAGTSICFWMFIPPPLNSDYVHDGENHDPYRIHEVPI